MASQDADTALINLHTQTIRVPIKSWQSIKNDRIIKQDLDYSCGAASLATLLNEFYGQSLTEKELLLAIDKGDLMSSFEDMKKALPKFGSAGFCQQL